MKSKILISIALILIFTLLISVVPGCSYPAETAESYTAIIPKVLHSNTTEALSISLFSEGRPVKDRVEVSLLSEGKEIRKVQKDINGKGTIEIDIPEIEEGEYEIKVKGTGFEDKASVMLVRSYLIFLETDKPIYKPGQTIHIRTITLNSELRPVSESVTIEVLDAKGIKIFRSEVDTDDYGLATLDLPISQEPNLGVWKITTANEKAKTQLDVMVEKYVLPKYEVKVKLPREWFIVGEPITGTITAEYSFGMPVKGELEIRASRYVGEWQEYATFSKTIDGETEFELPAASYVAGVPAASGLGNVILNIVVREKATGYEEKTNKLLTVAENPLNIQIIPESSAFKPGLPFSFLIITETPGNEPIEAEVGATITYLNSEYQEVKQDEKEVKTSNGKAMIEITPSEKSVALTIECFEITPISSRQPARASKVLGASYSPSGNFIHVEQTSEGIPQIGQEVRFKVYSTKQAVNFYYEVVSRGKVVFTDYTKSTEIAFDTTPLMASSSRLLVYQILPNSEVAADYIPFEVEAQYPHDLKVEFSQQEARPGEKVDIDIKAEGEAKVGIAAVDKSVFILAENRLNLQQVFDKLERLYMAPQVELHEVSIYPAITTKGAMEIFDDAGVVVLSNNKIPEGKEYKWEGQTGFWEGVWNFFRGDGMMVEEAMEGAPPPAPKAGEADTSGLAEVERIRQYFPETWLWDVITTGSNGKASLEDVEVPDTITTWMLRAVALSKEKGLGVAEDELRAFQPFFLSIDLPYSAIRGEEFPIQVAVYNYLDKPQEVQVEIEKADWFDLLDDTEKTVNIGTNDVGGVDFMIRAKKLGLQNEVKITARSKESADAVIKTVIIEPEGIARELVENLVLSEGSSIAVDSSIPLIVVEDSGRAYIALTSSYLTQTIDGLEELIQMPFGCGEQNMVVFAPDVYITKYLQESGQLKPEIMAKAEKLMITGYQRELTYRRSDGSFSAFGQSDSEGSLWLTAFVLKCFAQARGLMYIDDSILEEAAAWISAHQNNDGSFDSVGFVHHQEMMGGLQGKNALTAYVAIALLEAEEKVAAGRAIDYLESELNNIEDAYAMAITTYALELAQSDISGDAYQKLMELAQEDEDGLHWGSRLDEPEPIAPKLGRSEQYMSVARTADIEATGYATMALIEHGDSFNASRAAKWLVSRRNAYGGYGSTQDTVVALQALTEYSTGTRADVDLMIKIEATGEEKELRIRQDNFDVLQIVEVPVNEEIQISVQGKGEAIAQVVKRFNLPEIEKEEEEILKVSVDYDVTQVEVNDLVTVSVELEFNPPVEMEAGMVVLDVSVPTGFAPVVESITRVVDEEENIKRYEVAGRKVIFYIENMFPGDIISFDFQVKALYPVKAKSVSSQAYSYYKPEIRGEALSQELTVSEH
ncbi:MAG TPA: alpha-2-macroglobulin [Dehalococcoidia bacterium]|nr:alpha-2-macroglobulin [Dehalococcoidia bacterium]